MAAATPSRPSLCVVPSAEVLLLAEELQGLGGNDVALATVSRIHLNVSDALNLTEWLRSGFTATIVPMALAQAFKLPEFLAYIMQSLHDTPENVRFGLAWAVVKPKSGQAIDGVSQKPLSPVTGMRSATILQLVSINQLRQVVQPLMEHTADTDDVLFISLCAFNPGESTLAAVNVVVVGGIDTAGHRHITQLLGEVTALHSKGRAGEHILRTARLSVVNQFAAPLVAGNTRLFIPTPLEGESSAVLSGTLDVNMDPSVIHNVCTRLQVPEQEVRWLTWEEYSGAFHHNQMDTRPPSLSSQQRTTEQEARDKPNSSKIIGHALSSAWGKLGSREENATLLAPKLDSKPTPPAHDNAGCPPNISLNSIEQGHCDGNPSEHGQDSLAMQISLNGNAVSTNHAGCGYASETDCGMSEASPAPTEQTTTTVDNLRRRLQQISGWPVNPSFSLAPLCEAPTQEPAVRASGRSLPVTRGVSGLSSPSAEVCVGSPSRSPAGHAQRLRAPPRAITSSGSGKQVGYSATFAARHQSDVLQAPSISAVRNDRVLPVTHQSGAAFRFSSTAPLPQATDVFNSIELAKPTNNAHERHLPGVDEEDDEYSESSAPTVSITLGQVRSSQQDSFCEDVDGLDMSAESLDQSPDSVLPQEGGEAAAELEKERRINALLLRQLQDAEERAALATAAAAAAITKTARSGDVPMLASPLTDSVDPSDFSGAILALRDERQRTQDLQLRAQQAVEQQLSVEVALAAVQRELVITRARCKALERGTSLAHAYEMCEREVQSCQERCERLEKENVELSMKVAESDLNAVVKDVISRRSSNNLPEQSSSTTAVVSTLHSKLQAAQIQIRRLLEAAIAQQGELKRMERTARGGEVARRAADEANRRNAALQGALTAAEAMARTQGLDAAEAWAAVEELIRERDEAQTSLHTEQRRVEELTDLTKALRAQLAVCNSGVH